MRILFIFLLSYLPLAAAAQQLQQYKIGDSAFCGIVFYLENLDTFSGRQRGLVCAMTDQQARIRWDDGSYQKTRATNDGMFASRNADVIMSSLGRDSLYAATACFRHRACGDGWYLPSKAELHLMYLTLANNSSSAIRKRAKFKREGYWSSLEWSTEDRNAPQGTEQKAWIVNFFNGVIFPVNKANKYRVRAIREFRNFDIQ